MGPTPRRYDAKVILASAHGEWSANFVNLTKGRTRCLTLRIYLCVDT